MLFNKLGSDVEVDMEVVSKGISNGAVEHGSKSD